MKDTKFEELRKTFHKYVVKTDNFEVIEDIINHECPYIKDTFISESGKFLTDSFTFLKEMENVPQCYRERLFNSFYGTRKTDIANKWYNKTFKSDMSFGKHLSSHILCLMRGFVNEQKRKYNIKNVKNL